MQDEAVFPKFLSSLKRKWLLAFLAGLGILLVLLGGTMTKNSTATANPTADQYEAEYRRALEENIGAMCKKIKGAGEVFVMVTLAEGNTYTYSGGKQVAHTLPKVLGVAVICEGGDKEQVKAEITEMIGALLDIGTHKIYVGKSK